MKSDKPLKMATCTKCATEFFVSEARPGPYGGEMRIHDTAPSGSKDREIVPITCPACGHEQYAEFNYGC